VEEESFTDRSSTSQEEPVPSQVRNCIYPEKPSTVVEEVQAVQLRDQTDPMVEWFQPRLCVEGS
jgi:hypothetical protein